jgi:transketolase C-terminal domain/subunit
MSKSVVAVAVGIAPDATIVFILTSSSLLSRAAEDFKNASAKSPCPVASAFSLT